MPTVLPLHRSLTGRFHLDDSESQDLIDETMSSLFDTISTFVKHLGLYINGIRLPQTVNSTMAGPEVLTLLTISGTRRLINVHHLDLGPHAEVVVHYLPDLQSFHMEHGPWDCNAFRPLLDAITGKNITRASVCYLDICITVYTDWQCESRSCKQ
jgi:hypothetical protein